MLYLHNQGFSQQFAVSCLLYFKVEALQRRIAPHLLRRVKEDVAKDIPPKEETIIDVELTTMQKQYYRFVDVSMSVCLSECLSISLSICLSVLFSCSETIL